MRYLVNKKNANANMNANEVSVRICDSSGVLHIFQCDEVKIDARGYIICRCEDAQAFNKMKYPLQNGAVLFWGTETHKPTNQFTIYDGTGEILFYDKAAVEILKRDYKEIFG